MYCKYVEKKEIIGAFVVFLICEYWNYKDLCMYYFVRSKNVHIYTYIFFG